MADAAKGSIEFSSQPSVSIPHTLVVDGVPVNVKTDIDETGFWIKNADTDEILGGLYARNGVVFLGASMLVDPRIANDFAALFQVETVGEVEAFGMALQKAAVRPVVLRIIPSAVDSTDYNFELIAENDAALVARNGYAYIRSGLVTGGRIYLSASESILLETGDLRPLSNGEQNCGGSTAGFKYFYGTHTSIQSTSDERAKQDMQLLDADQMLKFIMAINASWYRLIKAPEDLMAGVGARQLKEAIKAAGISEDYAAFNGKDPDHLCVDYGQLIAPLISVAQEHQRKLQEFEKLQQKVTDLESRLQKLEGRIQ